MSDADRRAQAWRIHTRLSKAAADAGLDVPLPGATLTVGRAGSPVAVALTMTAAQAPHVMVTPPWLAAAAGLPPEGLTLDDPSALSALLRQIVREADRPPPTQSEAVARLRALPAETEVERQVRARVGQDLFRALLLHHHGGRCAVTGVRHPRLLRASHIKPWAECRADEERLDPQNGLLLAAHLDAAFDAHLLSFDRAGQLVLSAELPAADREALGLHPKMTIGPVSAARWAYLSDHLARVVG